MPKVVFHVSIRSSPEVVPLDDYGVSQKLWDSWSEDTKFSFLQNFSKQYLIDTFGEQALMGGRIKVTPEVVKEEVRFIRKVFVSVPDEEVTLGDYSAMSSSDWASLTEEQKQDIKDSWQYEDHIDASRASAGIKVIYEEIK